ncbi:MAG: hypothetical protein ACI959_002119 [Limisphaerales bacterium]|jgi:hypothetical protein
MNSDSIIHFILSSRNKSRLTYRPSGKSKFTNNSSTFTETALKLFRFQAVHNKVYAQFLAGLKTNIDQIKHESEIPHLPISLFKSHSIITEQAGNNEAHSALLPLKFKSSTTTGAIPSIHLVPDAKVYTTSASEGFEHIYGPIKDWAFLCLLPGYLERPDSSLVHMCNQFITESKYEESGFFLDKFEDLLYQIEQLQGKNAKIMLIGVSFALLDLLELKGISAEHPTSLQQLFKGLTIVETGGMKGRRKELVRADLHAQLCLGFGLSKIHSEYGMTELLSQAWSKGNGVFTCPNWMKVSFADPRDPLSLVSDGQSGMLNVIDLANIWSCAFIATEDLGRFITSNPSDGFEVLGRMDHAAIRGCSLMVAQ